MNKRDRETAIYALGQAIEYAYSVQNAGCEPHPELRGYPKDAWIPMKGQGNWWRKVEADIKRFKELREKLKDEMVKR